MMIVKKPSDELFNLFTKTRLTQNVSVPPELVEGVLRELGKLPRKTVTKTGYYCENFPLVWTATSMEKAQHDYNVRYNLSHGGTMMQVTWAEEVED